MRRALFAAALLQLGITSCDREGEPRPQWIVRVSTDAPIPSLGDRVMVDVLDSKGKLCADCRRTFEVIETTPLPMSFGVADVDGDPPSLRIRLYRSRHLSDNGEPGDPTIDLLARLPAASEGVTEVDALLATRCFGRVADPTTMRSCEPEGGGFGDAIVLKPPTAAGLPLPNSFGGGDRPCVGDAPDGMKCVPGGIFLMGSLEHGSLGPDIDPVPEQLVRLSPYFMDVDEFTLDDLAEVGSSAPRPVRRDTGAPFCTYDDGATGTLPVNCISRDQAARICQLVDKRLPTEAEWEFAAGNRSLDTVFPWIDSDSSGEAICAHATIARGGLLATGHSRECLLLDPELEEGPTEASPEDVTTLGLQRLGGSVSEWVADEFASYDDRSCWGDDYGLRDPAVCHKEDGEVMFRGGSFSDGLFNARVFLRRRATPDAKSSSIGFRCVRDAE